MQQGLTPDDLYQHAARLDVIFQSIEDGITVQDRSGHIVYANRTAARLLGYETPDDLLRAPLGEVLDRFEMFDEERKPVALTQIPGRRALDEGRPQEAVIGFRVVSTGVERWSSVKSAPVFDDSGALVLVVNVFSDVTDRKRASDERERLLHLERSARRQAEDLQRFFSFLAEAGSVLASSLDYETTLSSVADLAVPHIADWCAIHVIEEDGSVQQLAVAHVDPAKVALAHELERKYPFDPDAAGGAAAVLRTGEAELVSEIPDELLVAVSPDEELLAILRELGLHSSMVVPLIARGHVVGAITMAAAESGRHFGPSDLALAKELASRAAIAVDNARLYQRSSRVAAERAVILEHMVDGVVMADAAGAVTYMNPIARSMLGPTESRVTPAALVTAGRTQGTELPATAEESVLGRALAGELVVNVQRQLRRSDGSELVVRISATPIVEMDGSIVGAVAVLSDMTAERRLEEEKDAFLAAIAHDLRTPLATIKGLAQLLGRRMRRLDRPESEGLVTSLGQIDNAVMRMSRLINDLFDISSIEMGRPLDLNVARVDLVALLRSSAVEAQHATTSQRITFQTDIPELWGEWDGDRLARVFGNVLSNAVKYSVDGGEVEIRLMQEAGANPTAVVSVADCGIGIPAADLDRIFQRFYRAGNVQSRIGGTGIGLASAQQIVKEHGGTIEVESEEGKGTTVTIRLPLQHDLPDGLVAEGDA